MSPTSEMLPFTTASTVIERREYKYLVPNSLVPYVRAATQTTCRRDAYAGRDGLYTIRSLYFDSDKFHLFWANDREAPDRFKVRVRSYPAKGSNGPVFLEVKRRTLDVISKSRGMVAADQWAELIRNPGQLDRIQISSKTRSAFEKFLVRVGTFHLEPVMLVDYEREAFFSEVDDYARVTIDLQIRCQEKSTLDLEADANAWRYVNHPVRTKTQDPVTLLELKFAGPPPRWMSRMVQNLELQRYTFSKYGYSVQDQLTLPTTRDSSVTVEAAV